ncbi:VWA domain-containing protein [Streptomyces smaragdinus]|uniref:VWA domain-containing protein n=1 Tax=Streptomyces smaragdinus TaxID=2585196 RepID=UPI00188654F9|nr:VWA domain-containing protein [Streptomyces smaragdinus]
MPGDSRWYFESGYLAFVAQRAVAVQRLLNPAGDLQFWLYTESAHRLPPPERSDLAAFIQDWFRIPEKPLLADAPPPHAIQRSSEELRLFERRSVPALIEAIVQENAADPRPTLVLFLVHGDESDEENRNIALALDAAADESVFWQFFGDPDDSVLGRRIGELRRELPHIENMDYALGWDPADIQYRLRAPYSRALTKPFKKWLKNLPDESKKVR